MRRSWIVFLILTVTFSISCRHKPAYSEIQSKDPQANRAPEQPPADSSEQAATPPAGETPAANPEQPAPPPPPETAGSKTAVPRVPEFIDQRTGEFKDLPNYPNAYRTNAQIGPIDGNDAGMFLFETTDSFQSIREFYDKAIKKHGWIIAGHIRDQEHLKWELVKGKTSEGLVEVKSDFKTNRKGIILSRVERAPTK